MTSKRCNIYAENNCWPASKTSTRFAAFQASLATRTGGEQQLTVQGQEANKSLVQLHRHL